MGGRGQGGAGPVSKSEVLSSWPWLLPLAALGRPAWVYGLRDTDRSDMNGTNVAMLGNPPKLIGFLLVSREGPPQMN